MAKTSFTGYARGQSFQQQPVPYDILGQQQRRDEQIVRNLKQRQQQLDRRAEKQEAALERKFRREEANIKENQRLEDTYYATRREAMAQNQRVANENAKIRIAGIEADGREMQALAAMVPTLAENLIQMKEARDENIVDAAYNQAIAEGLPQDRIDQFQQAEKDLWSDSERIHRTADAFEQTGAPARVVTQIRKGSNAEEYGRLKAYAEMAKGQFGDYVSNKLLEQGIVGAAETAEALEVLQIQFLKENGLYGFSTDFLGDLFLEMRGVRNAKIIDEEKREIYSDHTKLRTDVTNTFVQQKTPESLVRLVDRYSRTYDERGNRGTRTVALNKAFELLGDTTMFPDDEQVIELLQNTETDQGSYFDRFGIRVDELIRTRAEDKESEARIIRQSKTRDDEAAIAVADEYLLNNDDWDDDDFVRITDQLKAQGIDQAKIDKLTAKYGDQSVEGRANVTYWTELFAERDQNGTLTLDDINADGVPRSVRQQFRNRAREITELKDLRGVSDATIKAELKNNLTAVLGEDTLDKAYLGLPMALEYAVNRYNTLFMQDAKSLDPAKAHNNAIATIKKEISEGKGNFKVADYKQEGAGGQTSNYFTAFVPRTEFTKQGTLKTFARDYNDIVQMLKEDPNVIENKVIIDPAYLASMAQQIRNGQAVNIPAIFRDISAINPKRYGTPAELLNKQFKAGNHEERVGPGLEEQLDKTTNDPEVTKVIQKIRSVTDAKRAAQIINGGSRQVQYMAPRVAQVYQKRREVGNSYLNYMTQDLGMSQNHALGILANIIRESNLDPKAASGDDGGPGGLFQWFAERQTDEVRRLVRAGDWKGQIEYALREEGEPGQQFLNMQFATPEEAADWWMENWERPADLQGGSQRHIQILNNWK